jgi:small subunit ribosomal protein S9
MAQNRFYATGKRKSAVARVWLTPGAGKVTVNGMDTASYFGNLPTINKIGRPFALTENADSYDVLATLAGGGKCAQIDALAHGISRALLEVDSENRQALKKAGLLTRDSRTKERKKYGQRSARAKFQFSKR